MRGVTLLASGKYQARRYEHGKTISCGVHATEDEAVAALRSHAVPSDEPHAVASHDPDSIHLSAESLALLHEVMAAATTIHSLDRANDRALAIFKKYMWEQQTNPDWSAYKKSLKQP